MDKQYKKNYTMMIVMLGLWCVISFGAVMLKNWPMTLLGQVYSVIYGFVMGIIFTKNEMIKEHGQIP